MVLNLAALISTMALIWGYSSVIGFLLLAAVTTSTEEPTRTLSEPGAYALILTAFVVAPGISLFVGLRSGGRVQPLWSFTWWTILYFIGYVFGSLASFFVVILTAL